MASNSGDEINKLRRKLLTLEPSIREMLSLHRPTSILKEKLFQVEEIVMDIPDECTYLTTEWRGKLAKWYREFSSTLSEIETEPIIIDTNSRPPSPPSPAKTVLALPIATSPASSYLSSSMAPVVSAPVTMEVTSGDEWAEPPSVATRNLPKLPNDDLYRSADQNQPMTSTPANSTTNGNSHYGDQNLGEFMDDKNSVRCQLEEAFNKVQPLENFAIVEEVRKFAKLIAKADELLDPYWRDRDLQAGMMERLSQKLPAEKWDQFCAYVGESGFNLKTVRNLKRFLVRQLKVVYEELKSKAEQEEQKKVAAFNGGEESGEGAKFCVYCKNTGHIVDDCIQIKYTLCFICLEVGHTQRRCPVLQAQQNGGGGYGRF